MSRLLYGLRALALSFLAVCWTVPVLAQGDALETIQIRPNVHVIFGAGGNITVHVGEDGVILVDSGSADMADRVLEAVEVITDQPIRMIINTSADADHVGGNQALAATGVPIAGDAFAVAPTAAIVAHENVLLRMAEEGELPYEDWPTETYTAKLRSMYINEDGVVLMRQTGAHTNGDSIVHFRRADVIATGDILDLRQFPVIDPEKGGSIQGELAALNTLLDITIPAMPFVLKPHRTLVVPGHGYISDYAEVVEYQYMVNVIRDRIEALLDKGMSLEQVIDANPTAGFRERYGSDTGPWTTDMFVEAIYNDLKNAPEE
ncbi:MAG: MBL fold metallo-hydrolase [Gammaproteobacteria bacterium]|nr:MBL fold metallo-hydrolase [Gammaproteobacteria bacterium]MDH3507144.1 MBL fold metallo-hydrolase [Gammaproteobacteria bacterium]